MTGPVPLLAGVPVALAAGALGVVGLVLGLLLRARLATLAHRTDDEQLERAGSRPPHFAWVPVVTAVVAAAVGTRDASPAMTTTLLLATVWAAALVAVDLDVRRLPDVLTLPAVPAAAVLLAWCSWSAGPADRWDRWWLALACGLASGAVYLAMAFLDPGGLGMGDVKLAVPLGMLTGWWGWVPAAVAFALTFVVAAVWGVVAAVRTRGGLRTTFPLGPSMAVGAFVVLLLRA